MIRDTEPILMRRAKALLAEELAERKVDNAAALEAFRRGRDLAGGIGGLITPYSWPSAKTPAEVAAVAVGRAIARIARLEGLKVESLSTLGPSAGGVVFELLNERSAS